MGILFEQAAVAFCYLLTLHPPNPSSTMSWSQNLQAYLAAESTDYSYACLYTVDGTSSFGECGAGKETLSAAEVANAVKAVKGSAKYQGVTVGGVKYVYLVDADEVPLSRRRRKVSWSSAVLTSLAWCSPQLSPARSWAESSS